MPAAPAGQKIRVLVVDDIAETRENIRKLLQFESDIEVVAGARTGKEGVALAKEHKPSVILMDINMPDMDGILATEQIMRDVPSAQIVILSVQSDADYMRRAMLAGARDFLTKPPSGDELIRTIRKVSEMGAARAAAAIPVMPVGPSGGRGGPFVAAFRPEGKIIAVYSPKGGVGCTTLATNLSIVMHSENSRVVAVDCNLQFGDIGVFFNLQSNHTILDVAGLEEYDPEVYENTLVPHNSGVKVLLSPPEPQLAGDVSGNQVKTILEHLRREYAYVVVDTASTLLFDNNVTASILDVADRVVLVTTPDIPAIKDARLFFELAEDYPPDKIVFVLNRVDKRGGISAADIEESLKHPVSGQIMADERSVLLSINQGIPLVMMDKRLPPVQGIAELAAFLHRQLQPEPEPAAPARDDKKAARVRMRG